jgi:hypothetical protein
MGDSGSTTPAIRRLTEALPATGINAHTTALRDHILAWAARTGLNEPDLARWGLARYERLLGRMYPDADLPLLWVAAEAVLWLMLVDGPTGPASPASHRSSGYSGQFARSAAAILAGAGPVPPPADPLLRGAWELTRNPTLPRSPWWRSRLFGHLATVAAAAHETADDLVRGRVPSIGEYVDRRRVASGWDVLADFGEASLAAPGLTGFSEYGRLRQAGGDIALAAGDILALVRERDVRAQHNLVLIVQHRRGDTPAAAASWVDRWLQSRLDDYLAARAALARAAADGDARAKAACGFVPALDAILRGILDWNLETSRY